MRYEMVAAKADELKIKGLKPSVRDVWKELRGDYKALAGHMRTWREQQPQAGAAIPELTAEFQASLKKEVAHQRREAVLTVATELQDAREQVEDLTREYGRLESASKAAEEGMHAAEAERLRLEGEMTLQSALAVRQQERLDEAHVATERARIEVAQLRYQTQGDADLLAALRVDLDGRRKEVECERSCRIDAERDLAAAQATAEGLQGRISELLGRLQGQEADRVALQSALEAERAARHTAERARDIAQERANAAVTRSEDLAERESSLRSMMKSRLC